MSKKAGSKLAFKIMALIHDNPLRRKFYKVFSTLEDTGLKSGQTVLEVGCGPGFFTIPAAKIIGEQGKLYALDIHPLAIESTTLKIKKEKLTNTETVLADITNTNFSNNFFDLIFLFGVPRMIRNELFLNDLIKESYRILKPKGIISIKTTNKEIVPKLEKNGFVFQRDKNGIIIFNKS